MKQVCDDNDGRGSEPRTHPMPQPTVALGDSQYRLGGCVVQGRVNHFRRQRMPNSHLYIYIPQPTVALGRRRRLDVSHAVTESNRNSNETEIHESGICTCLVFPSGGWYIFLSLFATRLRAVHALVIPTVESRSRSSNPEAGSRRQ